MFLGDPRVDGVDFRLRAFQRYARTHAGDAAHEVAVPILWGDGPRRPHVAWSEGIAKVGGGHADYCVRLVEIQTPSDDVGITTE